jgi:hypothetical protein
MKMCVPHLMPKISYEITKGTAVCTLLIVAPCLLLAIGNDFI